MEFSQFYTKWRATEPNLISEYVRSLDGYLMVEKNQESLLKGQRIDGKELPEYKNLTLQIKRETGGFISPSGQLAMKDTGGWYSDMKTKITEDSAFITNDNSLTGELIGRYVSILGVPDKEKQEVIEEARPRYLYKIKNALGL